MRDGGPTVAVVAPPGSALAAALGAALRTRGWHVVPRGAPDAGPPTATPVLVVLEDDDGNPAPPLPPDVPLRTCVCVASAGSALRLASLHARGAAVLDRAAPLLTLVGAVDHHLRTPRLHGAPDPALAAELHRRHTEHVALNRLTATERAVLAQLASGVGAAQIGDARHLSLHTVRSHIKSILAKLDVGSQLAAVAVARRSADPTWREDAAAPDTLAVPATFTTTGEAPARRSVGP